MIQHRVYECKYRLPVHHEQCFWLLQCCKHQTHQRFSVQCMMNYRRGQCLQRLQFALQRPLSLAAITGPICVWLDLNVKASLTVQHDTCQVLGLDIQWKPKYYMNNMLTIQCLVGIPVWLSCHNSSFIASGAHMPNDRPIEG